MEEFDLISFHPGRQHNLEQAFQIQKEFDRFRHLTSVYFDNSIINKWRLVAPKIADNLRKRSSHLPARFVDTNPWPELTLLVKKKIGYKAGIKDYLKRNEVFQQWVVKNYVPPKLCIGFDTSSWQVFKEWKGKSILVLDLTIGAPQYKLILAKNSHFDSQTINNLTKADNILYDIYEQEIGLADIVLCGSHFVKESCLSLGIENNKLIVLPYGADLKKFQGKKKGKNESNIKVVFVGTVNYRKGADIALKAWKQVVEKYPEAELHFYGGTEIEIPSDMKNIFFHGFISQDSLVKELETADISILPTFFEGSSLAIYQSMAMGLAVITTPNAGSIIEDKKDGLIVDYGSVQQLVEKLLLLFESTTLRNLLGANAEKNIQTYSWNHYGEKLHLLMNELILKSKTTS